MKKRSDFLFSYHTFSKSFIDNQIFYFILFYFARMRMSVGKGQEEREREF